MTLRDRIEEAAGWPRAHRTSTTVIVLLVAMLAVWKVITPEYPLWTDLRTGDCLYIRSSQTVPVSGSGDMFSPSNGDQAILSDHAERAGCDRSHSHEVLSTFLLSAPAGAAFPGIGPVIAEADAQCRPAFTTYVGTNVEASRYGYRILVPLEGSWATSARFGLCLLFDKTGTNMNHPAQGSRE